MEGINPTFYSALNPVSFDMITQESHDRDEINQFSPNPIEDDHATLLIVQTIFDLKKYYSP